MMIISFQSLRVKCTINNIDVLILRIRCVTYIYRQLFGLKITCCVYSMDNFLCLKDHILRRCVLKILSGGLKTTCQVCAEDVAM
jgi:hypothetical protein